MSVGVALQEGESFLPVSLVRLRFITQLEHVGVGVSVEREPVKPAIPERQVFVGKTRRGTPIRAPLCQGRGRLEREA